MGLRVSPDAFLLGVVSRLSWQKGLDLLFACLPTILSGGMQLALLGDGDADLREAFRAAASANPGHIGVVTGYDESLAHAIQAGSDALVVPSRFEPCGLTQLYALRYGTLPLVRRVGGLADTVVDATAISLADGSADGFAFDGDSSPALMAAVRRASTLFRERPIWLRMMQRAMTRDFSWPAAARRYVAVYRELQPGLGPV